MNRLCLYLLPLLIICGFAFSEQKFGVVNFAQCIQESKFGKKEQESFEEMKKKMSTLIVDIENQLKDISEKFSDPDYLDGLSPEGEQELKGKYQQLREEYERYQGQFYQAMNQTNVQMMQKMGQIIGQASRKVAQEKDFTFVINKEACFAADEAFDVTNIVVVELDRMYDEMAKNAEGGKAP